MGHETEIKIRVDRLDAVRERLQELGATISGARGFEDNLILDDADRRLLDRGENLRIRHTDGRALLRNILMVGDGMFSFGVGILIIVITPSWQRLGDLAGKTVVVRASRDPGDAG